MKVHVPVIDTVHKRYAGDCCNRSIQPRQGKHAHQIRGKIGSGSGCNGWFRCHELTSGGSQCWHDYLRTVKGTLNRLCGYDSEPTALCPRVVGSSETTKQRLNCC